MERWTYVVSSNHTVHKLQHSDHDQEGHEHINQLHPLWCIPYIAVPHPLKNLLCVLRVADRV